MAGGRCHARAFGAVQELLGPREGRQRGGNPVEDVAAFGHLGLLDGVPFQDDLLHRCREGILQRAVGPEHVRVAPDHLGLQNPGDIAQVKGAAFLGEPGVEHHLQQDVPQFRLQFRVAGAGLDGLGHLIGLLQEVLHEGLVGEGTHPGAMLAQGRDQSDEPLDG